MVQRQARRDARHAARSLITLVFALSVLGTAAFAAPGRPAIAVGASNETFAGAVSAADATSTETTPFPLAGKICQPRKGAYLGIFRPPFPYSATPLGTYKSLAGKPASMVMWFQAWTSKGANRFDTAMAVSAWQRGAVPIVVWEPWSPGDKPHNLAKPADMPAWQLSKIAGGTYDDYITTFARDVKSAGGPVMISLFHEMNGSWYPWCGTVNGNNPTLFKAAWRHVHDIFQREGATNVTWIWSINWESRPATRANRFSAYYPGSAYVDWVGVSGFNWGKGVGGGPWRSFDKIYKTPLAYLKSTHKPIMITEIASVENGGNKAAWLGDALKRIRTHHPEVKAVVYYDAKERSHGHVQDWRINSTKKSLSAYRKAVAPSAYVGTQAASLAAWRATLTSEQWVDLLGVRRLY